MPQHCSCSSNLIIHVVMVKSESCIRESKIRNQLLFHVLYLSDDNCYCFNLYSNDTQIQWQSKFVIMTAVGSRPHLVTGERVRRGSTIGEGGDKTISSPERSPKQLLPGIGLHDPLHGRQACPEFIAFDREVGQICPRYELIPCRFLPKREQSCYIPAPPPNR